MFFSVKHGMKIAGKVYLPCVCYPLTEYLKLTVKELEKKGKVVIHDNMVFFQNGRIIEKSAVVKETLTTDKTKKSKKTKKKAEETIAEETIAEETTAEETTAVETTAEETTAEDEADGF